MKDLNLVLDNIFHTHTYTSTVHRGQVGSDSLVNSISRKVDLLIYHSFPICSLTLSVFVLVVVLLTLFDLQLCTCIPLSSLTLELYSCIVLIYLFVIYYLSLIHVRSSKAKLYCPALTAQGEGHESFILQLP